MSKVKVASWVGGVLVVLLAVAGVWGYRIGYRADFGALWPTTTQAWPPEWLDCEDPLQAFYYSEECGPTDTTAGATTTATWVVITTPTIATTTTRPLLAQHLAETDFLTEAIAAYATVLGESTTWIREQVAKHDLAPELVNIGMARCGRLDAVLPAQRARVVADTLAAADDRYLATLLFAAAISHLCPHHGELLG